MSSALDIGEMVRIFAPPGFGVPGGFRSLREWLIAGSYSPVGDVGGNSFVLRAHNAADLAGALTEEYCACALSAVESFIELERGARNSKALAWPAIKAYYGAFFAAHAVIRFFGVGCTWLSSADVTRLKAVAGVHNVLVDAGPKKGQWTYRLGSNGTVEFLLSTGAASGGAHEVLWKTFAKTLEDVASQVAGSHLLGASDAQSIVLILEGLRHEAFSGMPSNIRNAVNYRREFGVWFPYSNFSRSLNSVLDRSAGWRDGSVVALPVAAGAADLKSMFNFSYAVQSLCLSLTRSAAKYFDGGSKRFSNGPLRLVLDSAS